MTTERPCGFAHPNQRNGLPLEQRQIREECFHTSTSFTNTTPIEVDGSIARRVESIAQHCDQKTALLAANGDIFTYANLHELISRTAARLNDLGIYRGDRVALVIPDGPQMALAFLSITATATCAPLNPTYREAEFFSLFTDLRPKALVVQSGSDSPAISAAKRLAIPIISLTRRPEDMHLSFAGEGIAPTMSTGFATAEDVALLLYTSGTTAKPKLVPLTHSNLLNSAHNIATTLELTSHDRCLNLMPLFHIHGLIGGLLASLVIGGSVVCPAGFNAPKFFEWLKEFEPTWYSAVPTMHQLILAGAQDRIDIIRQHPLRFIRSSSASMPTRVMVELEKLFGAPVIEAYGMTEAAHQMASNPLPPAERKPGSVGRAAGPEIAIMDEAGNTQSPGTIGEVVVRGANVMAGYVDAPEANQKAFAREWFRTGDQGYLDGGGYLFLTGRIKELINRAGEKIAPREIDEALMAHPAVEQAVTFAVPNPTLGEEVAAAVVLRSDARAKELREFVATRLADFKVPSQIVIVHEMPKGPTGKLQRVGLAQKLGINPVDGISSDAKAQYEPPSTALEKEIADVWMQVFKVDRIGRHDNFFHLGGYSLLAVQLVRDLEIKFGKIISVATLFTSPTIAELARVITEQKSIRPTPLIAVQPNGSELPFFCAHGTDGYLPLARYLGSDQPFYGLAQHLEGTRVRYTSIPAIATHYLEVIRLVQPEGPYYIGGHSLGGLIALEMAQQLRRQQQAVALLVLIDTRPSVLVPEEEGGAGAESVGGFHCKNFSLQGLKKDLYFLRRRVKENLHVGARSVACDAYHRLGIELPPQLQAFYIDQVVYKKIYAKAQIGYAPQPYSGRAVYLESEESRGHADVWKTFFTDGLDVRRVPGNHLSILQEPSVRRLSETLKECLVKAQRGA